MIKRRNIELCVLFGLIFSIVVSFAGFDAKCEEMRNGVLRLHIIANSDSAKDQALKLKVRDAVLSAAKEDLSYCNNLDDALIKAKTDINLINETAKKVINDNGYSYTCKTSVKKEYFDTRVYDNFSLPAGRYNSLTIRIGNAKGHNWWCVVFPAVCIPAAANTEKLNKSVSDRAAEVCYNSEKYVIGFKTAEIYEKLKEKLSK